MSVGWGCAGGVGVRAVTAGARAGGAEDPGRDQQPDSRRRNERPEDQQRHHDQRRPDRQLHPPPRHSPVIEPVPRRAQPDACPGQACPVIFPVTVEPRAIPSSEAPGSRSAGSRTDTMPLPEHSGSCDQVVPDAARAGPPTSMCGVASRSAIRPARIAMGSARSGRRLGARPTHEHWARVRSGRRRTCGIC